VLCGCAKKGLGIRELLDFCTRFMPDASVKATDELSGVIFKIEHDKTMGKIAHVRLFGGTVKNRDALAIVEPAAPAEEKTGEDLPEDAEPERKEPMLTAEHAQQIKDTCIEKWGADGGKRFRDITGITDLQTVPDSQYEKIMELIK
jgi:translation elongation factor EF-G